MTSPTKLSKGIEREIEKISDEQLDTLIRICLQNPRGYATQLPLGNLRALACELKELREFIKRTEERVWNEAKLYLWNHPYTKESPAYEDAARELEIEGKRKGYIK